MMRRTDQTIAIADGRERTIDTGLAIITGTMTETMEEEEAEEEGIHIVRRTGRKKDVWAETHTAALEQEQAMKAPSSSRAEAT